MLKIPEGVKWHKDHIYSEDKFYNLVNILDNFLTLMEISAQLMFGNATPLEAMFKAYVEEEWSIAPKGAEELPGVQRKHRR